MTQEEKAKAYDEALEKVKDMLKHRVPPLILEEKEFEFIFPELAESEDEKIRKAIIEYIKTGTYHKEWIDYLEKQGEQKPTDKVEPKFNVGDTIKYNGTEYKITSIESYGYKVYPLTYDEDAASLISFRALATLVEQESIESEDEKIRREIVKAIHDYANKLEEKIPTKWLDYLEKQKHEEWSEEDKNMLNQIINSGEHHCYLNLKEIDWLKSLHPQPKQEWSEEDHQKLQEAISMVEANGTWTRSKDAAKAVSNWLKSLEPSKH